MGQFCVSACSSVARILSALFVITGGEKGEPQIQMGRILSECRIEMMEGLARFGNAWRRNVIRDLRCHGERRYSKSSGYEQCSAEIGIVGHKYWRIITSRKTISLYELHSCSDSCVHLPQGNPQT